MAKHTIQMSCNFRFPHACDNLWLVPSHSLQWAAVLQPVLSGSQMGEGDDVGEGGLLIIHLSTQTDRQTYRANNLQQYTVSPSAA